MNHQPIGERRRVLPRYTDQAIHHDPLEAMLARHEAQLAQARAKVAAGHTLDADPADLRGIPCIARGVGGTSPGTNPLAETERRLTVRRGSLHS